MKKLWLGLLIGVVTVGGVAGGLMSVYSSDSEVLTRALPQTQDHYVPPQVPDPPEATAMPAFQTWQQIWHANMPVPDLVPRSETPTPPGSNQTIWVPGCLDGQRSGPLSVETRLEQITQQLEEMRKRLDALEQRRPVEEPPTQCFSFSHGFSR